MNATAMPTARVAFGAGNAGAAAMFATAARIDKH